MLWETFLHCLFFGNKRTLSLILGALSTITVKKLGLGLLNPVMPVKEKYLSFQQGSAEPIRAVMGGESFSNKDHLWTLG